MLINRKIPFIPSTLVSLFKSSKTGSFLAIPVNYSFSKPGDLETVNKYVNNLEDIVPEINRPREEIGGIYSVESILHKEEVSKELKTRLEDLRKRHELLRVELKKKIDIPFCLCGINRKTYH